MSISIVRERETTFVKVFEAGTPRRRFSTIDKFENLLDKFMNSIDKEKFIAAKSTLYNMKNIHHFATAINLIDKHEYMHPHNAILYSIVPTSEIIIFRTLNQL